MANNSYIPNPIKTNHIELETNLIDLIELLAEHAHDIWAQQRIRDGWSWGKNRCDKNKKHPCLIPYAELPESEKEYDRQAATGTLKAIIALGFTVTNQDETY